MPKITEEEFEEDEFEEDKDDDDFEEDYKPLERPERKKQIKQEIAPEPRPSQKKERAAIKEVEETEEAAPQERKARYVAFLIPQRIGIMDNETQEIRTESVRDPDEHDKQTLAVMQGQAILMEQAEITNNAIGSIMK